MNPSEVFWDNSNDKIRVVILGEASTLSAFILKNNQRLTKSNYIHLSRITSLIIEEDDEDEALLNDDYHNNSAIDPLLKNLILLKSRLSKEKLLSLDVSYIKPFCDVIVNKDVSGPVTGLALQSILKFLNYGFFQDGQIIKLIGESVTRARFVGTDSSSDEAVLMQILSVLENLITMPFYSLTNGIICEIMQSCFRIAFETRLNELLRKCAVKSLTEMVRALFTRLSHLDKETSTDYNYFYHDKNNASYHKLNKMGKRFLALNKSRKTNDENESFKQPKIKKEELSDSDSNQNRYGLACIHELLSYLISLINPLSDGQNTDYMISVGLHLLIVIFEVSVQEIRTKNSLLSVIKTDLCWNLMQLLQNEKNLNTFASVLRLGFLIFVNLRMYLKYQFEAFLLRLNTIIVTMNTPLEYRDLCLEYLLLFFRHIPYLSHELFFNFDCDPYSSNILEDSLQMFSKNCFLNLNQNTIANSNSSLNFTILQMLSLEVLLSNLKNLQKSELCQDEYLTANPATILVNISNFKDVENDSVPKAESDYDICKNASICHQKQAETQKNSDGVEDEKNENQTVIKSEENDIEIIQKSESLTSLNEIIQQQEKNVNSSTVNKYYVTYLLPDSSMLMTTLEQIQTLKQRKALLLVATERFNQKPAKGVEFLFENNLVKNDDELVSFLRNNSNLDKKMLGEYLSNKKNMQLLSKFVESYNFKGTRIDEALRWYLESFRLPGEAPLITLVLEQFAHHWHESNGCPFENEDAAFGLAYAIIMLNVDQHNMNAKRQTNPMTCQEFISNLRQMNGVKDFDRNMLTEIYHVIKNNEIVMPAEQQGVVREKYLWKCLLKNSESINGIYWFYDLKHYVEQDSLENFKEKFVTQMCILNKSIFEISWGPSISTLTLVFDKINPDRQPTLSKRILNNGFTSYSLLSANYGHLDNLIETLSKFAITSTRITNKSQMVAYCLFNITREYSNEMRTSWKNIIELILFWYDNKLLDNGFEVEDFALESMKIKFSRKLSSKNLKQSNDNGNQSTFFSSFYSYFASNTQQNDDLNGINNGAGSGGDSGNNSNQVSNLANNQQNDSSSVTQNDYSQTLLLIIEESKFLHIDSLIELIKAIIQVEYSDSFDDDIQVFKLEILLKVIFMNRDRLSIFWELINKHLIKLMKCCSQSEYLTERIISAVFRLAIRFTSRPDSINDQIFLLLYQILLFFDPMMLQKKLTAHTLHSFVSHCNCFFTKIEEWSLIFNYILAVSIGYYPPIKKNFMTEIKNSTMVSPTLQSPTESLESSINKTANQSQQMFLANVSDLTKLSSHLNLKKNFNEDIFSLKYPYRILNVEAYEKCVDVMVMLVREYLPNNSKTLQNKLNESFVSAYEIAQIAVSVLCRLVEASIKIQFYNSTRPQNLAQNRGQKNKVANKSGLSRFTNILSSSESDSEDEMSHQTDSSSSQIRSELSSVTENVALKLLDLMHFFHLYAPSLLGNSVSSEALWNTIWCPLLQAIAFFCCDSRRPVRTCAFTFLQRTLLLHDLNSLNAAQWESCFNKVLFPLLSKLLEPINMCDPIGMDETRMRTTNLLCKVFLQHLNPLLTLGTFTALWLTILDFMDKYIKANMQTELVKEAIPESLKNILLVMKTAGCFNETLASITWDRIKLFLPNLYQELIIPHPQTILAEESESKNELLNESSNHLETINKNSQEMMDSLKSADQKSQQLLAHSYSHVEQNAQSPSYDSQAYHPQILSQADKDAVNQPQLKSPLKSAETINNQTLPSKSELDLPQPVIYNLPSTYIDMESVCSYPESLLPNASDAPVANVHYQQQPSKLSATATTVAYPGIITQYSAETNKPVPKYFHHYTSLVENKYLDHHHQQQQPQLPQSMIGSNMIVIPGQSSSVSTSPSSAAASAYPWPMPSLAENSNSTN